MVDDSASQPALAESEPSTTRTAAARTGLLRAARLRDWAHFLLLPLAGYEPGASWTADLACGGRGMLIAAAVLAFGYLLNGIADRHMDASTRKNPLAAGLGAGRWSLALVALAAAALATSLLGPIGATAATGLALLSGVTYSVGPRLKRHAVLGTLANVTNFAPLLWVGLHSDGSSNGLGVITAAFVLLLLQNQLLHEAADREDDRRGGVRTTFQMLGVRAGAAAIAALGLGLGALLLRPGLAPLAVAFGAIFGVATPLFAAWRGSDTEVMARVRVAHRVASVLAGGAVFAVFRLGWMLNG